MVMRKIKCPHCGYEWNYKGKLRYATCPNCLKKFKLEVEMIVSGKV